ncbi:hypothetical protein GCM10009557_90500 [Virgisporangium ochraceum]
MRTFTYHRASDVADAVAHLTPDASYLAGGTNLVDLMKLGVATPGTLVDINRLGLDGITAHDGLLRIGAAVRNSDLAAHPLVREALPALNQALRAGASG